MSSILIKVFLDIGNSKDKIIILNQKKGQIFIDEGKLVGQVFKIQQGNISYQRSSSGSGGDDGGEDRQYNLRIGGC